MNDGTGSKKQQGIRVRGEEKRSHAIASALPVCFIIALAGVSAEAAAAELASPKPVVLKIEKLACRLGTEDTHARIAVEVLNGRVNSFAYYSKWKPRTCSLEIVRGDAFSKWLDEGSTTAVHLRARSGYDDAAGSVAAGLELLDEIAGETRPAPLRRGIYCPQQHRRQTDKTGQWNLEGGVSGRCGGALWGQ